jgi:hypothetical protein
MDAKRTFLDRRLDLGNPGSTTVDHLKSTTWRETTSIDGKYDRVKEWEIGAVERAIDEDRRLAASH